MNVENTGMRIERDSLGEYKVPADALYGIHTARARENFRISGMPLSQFPELVRALAMVKKAAAAANTRLGVLPSDKCAAIQAACDALLAGEHHAHFAVDMIQGGAGTSTNMNANEVIANLALERLGHAKGDYRHLHPNDDVNRSQSTNDVYPTALRLAILMSMPDLTLSISACAMPSRPRRQSSTMCPSWAGPSCRMRCR